MVMYMLNIIVTLLIGICSSLTHYLFNIICGLLLMVLLMLLLLHLQTTNNN